MAKKDFYESQSALTAAKIGIYREYLKGYLPKLLLSFGSCLIADLFCGAGKNGEEDGSPLVLIQSSKYILTSPNIKKKHVQVKILFNDQDAENIKNLKEALKILKSENHIKILETLNEKFEDLLPIIIKEYSKWEIPKFFFLDPFKYSNVKMQDLKQLMGLPNSEVLLFIPIFHSYRFASDTAMSKDHKTRIFVEEFTTKGIADYHSIDDFMHSVKEKLLKELSLKYVRPVLLDDGSGKNALFLLTNNQKGMLLMNKIALKKTNDGNRVEVKNQKQESLFSIEDSSKKFMDFEKKLINLLKIENNVTNKEIVDFTIINELLPKHGGKVINDLFEQRKIKVKNTIGVEITNKKEWNIAEKITKVSFFYLAELI